MSSSTDEAEVAELLAELPTHCPPPLYRRWAKVPLLARVRVHGLLGWGNDTLFRGAPTFSAALWRCTGYVQGEDGKAPGNNETTHGHLHPRRCGVRREIGG